MDDMRCSLPSISDLFNSAGIGSSAKPEQAERPPAFAGNAQLQQPSQQAMGGHEASRVMLPPTPPLRPDQFFDGGQSPSSSSQLSSSSLTTHYPPAAFGHLEMSPQTSTMSNRPTILPSSLSYAPPSSQLSVTPYGPVNDFAGGPPEWYHQRSPPHAFLPSTLSTTIPGPSGTNPWQHHHHIPPSSQAAFAPSQDRYICQTCSKAFSRPSSLRIHSHSHTGEKPFKCPHQGCGKAFSVRSNMKRHERGCHATSPPPM